MEMPAVGDRIRLISMPNDPCPIEPGSEGVVQNVVDLIGFGAGDHQIWVKWDSGRTLSLVCPPDEFAVISERAKS